MASVDVSSKSAASPESLNNLQARLMNGSSSSAASSVDQSVSIERAIQQLLQRGERLDCIVECSEDLSLQSKKFYRKASSLSSWGIGSWFSGLVAPLASLGSAAPQSSSSNSCSADEQADTPSASSSTSSKSKGAQELIAKQKANGAWDIADAAPLYGKQGKQLVDELLERFPQFKEDERFGPFESLAMILGTALALEVLQTRFAREQDEWTLVARKGMAWLRKTLAIRKLGDEELGQLLRAALACVN
jgi:hypothetical protein